MMIHYDADQYTASSLAIAKNEYNSRRIEKSQEIIFEGELKTHIENVENRKKVGASFLEKCLCFFFPGLILFMALENLRAKGYMKKAKDLKYCDQIGNRVLCSFNYSPEYMIKRISISCQIVEHP